MKPRLGKQQMGKNYRAKPGNWIGASAHVGLNSNKYLVGLGYRPGPQLTLPGRIGSLTRAYTHSASSDWDIDPVQLDWIINTSLHNLIYHVL